MTGLRRKQLEAVYSGGTVRGSHTVLYSPVRGVLLCVAAGTADIYFYM
jgi:hypothetical protein